MLRGELQSIAEDPALPFAIALIDVDGAVLRCQLTRHAVRELGLQPGMPVFALLKTASFNEYA